MRKPIEEYTEFQRYIKSKFDVDGVYEADYLFALNAPEEYEVEEEMLNYIKRNQDATLEDILNYFTEIVPPGLPPCASKWEDDEEDE